VETVCYSGWNTFGLFSSGVSSIVYMSDNDAVSVTEAL
jgi:hypothetical protein